MRINTSYSQAGLSDPALERVDQPGALSAPISQGGNQKVFFPELEILRGIAAVSVTWIHCWTCLIPLTDYQWRSLPLQSLADLGHLVKFLLVSPFNGRNAVVFFFVLSGFVLAHALESRLSRNGSGGGSKWRVSRDFLIGRFFRIYPAATVITILSTITLVTLTPQRAVWPGSPWFVRFFAPLDYARVMQALWQFQSTINPVYWTLRVEVFISCLFPVIFFVTMDRLRPGLRSGWAAAVFALFVSWWFRIHYPLEFLFCFPLGIVAYKMCRFRKPAVIPAPVTLLLGTVLLCFACWLGPQPFSQNPDYVFAQIILEALGAFLIIRAATSASPVRFPACLRRPLFSYLGRHSFSIYLIHFLILEVVYMAVVKYLPRAIDDRPSLVCLGFAVLTVPAAVLASHPLYHYVEAPGIEAGKRCIRLFKTL